MKTRGSKVLSLFSESGNTILERPYFSREDIIPLVHAKYNSLGMSGIDVVAGLRKSLSNISCSISSARIYRVSDSLYSKTFVANALSYLSLASDNTWQGNIPPVALGSNEITGAETYYLEIEFQRARKKYRTASYFNHLGVFDSLNRLRQGQDLLYLTKMEE